MYEAVYAHPDGASTVSRLAKTAAEYDYEGIVLKNAQAARFGDGIDQSETGETAAESVVSGRYGVDVVRGVEIRPSGPEEASGSVGGRRPEHTIVSVLGGSGGLNRFAVENEKVDVLAKPMANGGDVNHVLANAAVENGVRFEFDLGPVVHNHGGQRVRAIQGLRKLHEIVSYYEAPYVVSLRPETHLDFRAPRELAALGEEVGLPAQWIREGLAEWGRLAARNRRIDSDSFIEPGVERGRYETER